MTAQVGDDINTAKSAFLRRVRIRGYKSIAFCDVSLEPLTILVGRNASGKSNFVDALAFVRDAVETNITEAAKRRGGWNSISCRSSPGGQISFEMEIALPESLLPPSEIPQGGADLANYGFTLAQGPLQGPVLVREWFEGPSEVNGERRQLDLTGAYEPSAKEMKYDWTLTPATRRAPYPRPDRLWISSFGEKPFREVSEALRLSGYYNFQPKSIRAPQHHVPGTLLEQDGKNLAGLIETICDLDRFTASRIRAYLSAVVGEVEGFTTRPNGEYNTLWFRLRSGQPDKPQEFEASSMSDGTLRALAALAAAFQIVRPSRSPSLVAIEEPETSLHPAAMRALVAAMDEATLRTQILLTTHSPDLLDAEEVKPENLRVVRMVDGQTILGPVDDASVEIVRRNLNSLGGLERENQLEPDLDDQERQLQLSRNGRWSPE